MPRRMSEKALKAEAMFREGKKLTDIAKTLDVPDGTVRRWKHDYGWDNTGEKGKKKQTERSEKTKEEKPNVRNRGAPKGNRNGVGHGPPRGNKNAEKHGGYSAVYWDTLDDEECELSEDMPTDEEQMLLDQIRLLSVRERRILKAIQKYRNMRDATTNKEIPISVASTSRTESKRVFDGTEEEIAEQKELYRQRIQNEIDSNQRHPGHEVTTITRTENKDDVILRLERELTAIQSKKTKAIESLAKLRLEKQKLDERNQVNALTETVGGKISGDVYGQKNSTEDYPTVLIPENGRDTPKPNILGPQAGPQTMFMASGADIVIYGGAAGGGKTYALLLEALRHKDIPGFGGIIFRKNNNQITAEGGLWDASIKLYSQVPGTQSRKTPRYHWSLGAGSKLSFAYIERDDDLRSWQGTEIAYIGFDELTHFTKRQFLYMLSRNRSTCGIKPYMRATCNPDSDSWVAKFISWWINQETGYPIPERSGIIRYMCVLKDEIFWGASREELADKYGVDSSECKSFTFIASRLEDNKILMEKNPGYLANLKALSQVDMERLLKGNWKIKKAAGSFFKRIQVGEMLETAPDDLVSVCRGWDLAATDKDEDENAAYTAGVLMGKRKNGRFVIIDVINQQLKAGDVRSLIAMTAKLDSAKYGYVRQRLPQDPGQAGKEQAQSYMQMLAGYDVAIRLESGDKATRAEPMAAQWQHGFFDVVIGEWNEMYFNQLESFPDSKFKDMVDAGSSAFNELTLGLSFNIDNLL